MLALSTSVISIIQTYLVGEGIVTEPSDGGDWPLYTSHLPDVIGDCGAIYDRSGKLDGKLSNGEVISHPGIQLSIRSDDYETGYAKAEAIALLLDGVNKETVVIGTDSYLLQNVSRAAFIISNIDAKRRFLFMVNFLVTLKKL